MSLHIIQHKMTLLKERLVTTLTITWFFLSVCQHMLHQMTIVREVFAAILTIEYFTNHYVDREGSGTKLIWIQPLWFNFRLFMYLHMWNKIVFLPNDLSQCSQWCGFSLLCHHVLLKMTPGRKTLAALLTTKQFTYSDTICSRFT